MKVKVEKAGPCRKILEVIVPAETVEAEYKTALAAFVKSARVPGFRPGRSPPALVERRYAREIDESVRDALVARTYPEALKRATLDPVAVLDLNVTLKRNEDATYKVTLDVPPEFKLPKYKGISLKQNQVRVAEEAVQQALEKLLERQASFEAVEGRTVLKGDAVQVDFEGRVDGKPLAELGKRVSGLAQARDLWVMADENASLPGFGAALIGLAVGADREITVAFPADFKIRELAGKTAIYQARVKAVRAKRMPALDAEFLKKAGVESETELRGKLKESLAQEAERLEKERRKEEIVRYLLARTALELPETLVQEEIHHQFSSLVRQNLLRGVSREILAEKRADLLSNATSTATEKVKLGYILHRIAEEEKITVADAELDGFVESLAQRFSMAVSQLRQELEEKKELDSIRRQLRADKTLDFLLAHAGAEEAGLFSRLTGR
ncbi:MAG: trigger factor [Lentisphaerae bacterium]|nr:trigger factor [Lentisphaerota bacterium]